MNTVSNMPAPEVYIKPRADMSVWRILQAVALAVIIGLGTWGVRQANTNQEAVAKLVLELAYMKEAMITSSIEVRDLRQASYLLSNQRTALNTLLKAHLKSHEDLDRRLERDEKAIDSLLKRMQSYNSTESVSPGWTRTDK